MCLIGSCMTEPSRGDRVTETPVRLTAALADRYLLERELGQGGMVTDPRMNSLLGNAWLRHARVMGSRPSRSDVLPSRGVQPRDESGA